MAKSEPSAKTNSESRTRKMRAVLAACRRLQLDEDARRDLQESVTGIGSMAAMSEAQLGRLLDHLNRDYKGTNPERSHLAKIKALWWSLYWLALVVDPSDKALSAFVERQTGISALRFLDHAKSHAVIEALKAWLNREGVRWQTDSEIEASNASWKVALSRSLWDRHAVIDRLSQLLFSNDLIFVSGSDFAQKCLDLPRNRYKWSARQLDDAIRLLGRKWRAERPAP